MWAENAQLSIHQNRSGGKKNFGSIATAGTALTAPKFTAPDVDFATGPQFVWEESEDEFC